MPEVDVVKSALVAQDAIPIDDKQMGRGDRRVHIGNLPCWVVQHQGQTAFGRNALEQIGGLMGLTRERIRQLKERALSKLRHPTRNQTLKTLADDD